ncbi:MAG TPA: trypsin-like peptidase domain-containing protein, partial [Spirochaetota bacterium]|nr:trypsin-like peptidase domain-containing protein [Spirochaetota bacterium]
MKKINYFFFLLFSLFLLNCRQPRQPRDPAAFYESKTKTCIDKGMLSLACHNINKYSYMLPTKTDSLLQKMIKREKEFLKYYRDQKNIKKMFFHIRNLMALGVYTHTKFTNYERKIAGAFRGVEDAYYKYLSIKHKIPGWQETVKPTRNREYYKSILVKINIDIIYESQSTGLKRDFHKMGSGFFINKNMILTAFHVVENFYDSDNITKELKITTADGKIINGTLHACDPLLDLALIKTDKPADIKNMIPTYQLCGDSSSVKPGENVYCFGHHLGLKYTLTRGIISGRNRRAPEYATWLQVDAALSGGASGGLLIGEDGHIYGMIVAGMIYEDVNFVVPSQLILSALDRLKQGHISRGWLGMSVYTEPYKKSKVRVKGFYDCSPLYNTE